MDIREKIDIERKENEHCIPITISTHVPSKWRFIDLETGDIWKWENKFKKANDIGYHKVEGEPPVLSDEELKIAYGRGIGLLFEWSASQKSQNKILFREMERILVSRAIAQAQRDADVRYLT